MSPTSYQTAPSRNNGADNTGTPLGCQGLCQIEDLYQKIYACTGAHQAPTKRPAIPLPSTSTPYLQISYTNNFIINISIVNFSMIIVPFEGMGILRFWESGKTALFSTKNRYI